MRAPTRKPNGAAWEIMANVTQFIFWLLLFVGIFGAIIIKAGENEFFRYFGF